MKKKIIQKYTNYKLVNKLFFSIRFKIIIVAQT